VSRGPSSTIQASRVIGSKPIREETVMKNVVVITGASSGFGALTARALARGRHIVYASMRDTTGRNAPQVGEVAQYAAEYGVDLRTVELDVASDASVNAGIAKIIADTGRLDVVVHNAGHMSFGPAEAGTRGAPHQRR
jgi:NAD(P)-dependent dehydrogenase (short-subunit alcohol dehydrogenase family)